MIMKTVETLHDELEDQQLQQFLAQIAKEYQDIYILLAPPRSASTAIARAFWQHPKILAYCHEPFDVAYRRHFQLRDIPLSFRQAIQTSTAMQDDIDERDSLFIKEMTFQVGPYFPLLFSLTKQPLLFVIRNPLLSIASRMRKLQEGEQNALFPFIEMGWSDLLQQVTYCWEHHIPYIIVDSNDFRANPQAMTLVICERLGLRFVTKMLTWRPLTEKSLGNLGGEQDHWYQRVLTSTGVQPATEEVPSLSAFPEAEGFRKCIEICLNIYHSLLKDENRLVV